MLLSSAWAYRPALQWEFFFMFILLLLLCQKSHWQLKLEADSFLFVCFRNSSFEANSFLCVFSATQA
jgi:hypothetical protein